MFLSSIHFPIHFIFHYGWPESHSHVYHRSFSLLQLMADSVSLLPWSQQQLARMGRCLCGEPFAHPHSFKRSNRIRHSVSLSIMYQHPSLHPVNFMGGTFRSITTIVSFPMSRSQLYLQSVCILEEALGAKANMTWCKNAYVWTTVLGAHPKTVTVDTRGPPLPLNSQFQPP